MEVIDKSFELEELRHRRAQECFPIINRGYSWYSTLNNDQKLELKNWYFAWLDVTETRNIPKKPEWLNKKIEREEILL